MTLTWIDDSITETAFVVQKSSDGGVTWMDLYTVTRLLTDPNTAGDTWDYANAGNEIASGGFPTVTATSVSAVVTTP